MNNNEEVLNIVFKISDWMNYEVNEVGIVTIFEKQDHKIQRFFRKLNFKIPMNKKIELDEYSSAVFLEIDGKKNVKDIGINLEAKFGNKLNPLYERLLIFLNHLDIDCEYIEKIN